MVESRSPQWWADLQGEARQSGSRNHPDSERKHHNVDRRTTEIDELADRFHAVEEDKELKQPHEKEACPTERGKAEYAAMPQRLHARQERDDEHLNRLRREISLHAVPDDADD